METRKLFLPQGYSSLFSFCVGALGLSEASASKRIQVSRLAKRHPDILERIARGELTMANASLLAPYVTTENREMLVNEALHKPKREVEKVVVRHFPKPDVPETIRKLPTFPGAHLSSLMALH